MSKLSSKTRRIFLFNEVDSIFSPNSIKEAKKLKIYEMPLLFDIGFEVEFIEIFSTNCSNINTLIWFNAEHKTNLIKFFIKTLFLCIFIDIIIYYIY